jgi:hypothetical protein
MNAAGALLYGFAHLFHPRMLWLMIWPMLIAVGVWGTVALALWTRTAIWLAGILARWIEPAASLVHFDTADAALIAAQVLLFLLFVPLVYLTALFILGIFGMQKMVDHVASRSFPQLERRRGGATAASAWNGVVALLGMAGLFAEHADRQEMARIFRARRGGMYLLGLLMAIAAYVPLVGFVAPVLFGLAFIRYLLGALEELRRREAGST